MPVIAITGASSGIGRATARHFLAQGWQVALLARRADALAEAAQDHPEALPLVCDVADEDSVAAAFEVVAARFGRLDALFNNAGFMPRAALIDEIDPADWRRIVDVNLTGMFLCARAAFGRMRRQSPPGGRIINNGSIAATAPRPGSVGYTATKHAITGLTKALELDGRRFGITCGQIDIGNARSPMTAGIAAGATQPDGTIRPEPVMEVETVARTVFHMASLPPDATIPFLTLMAPGMPWIGRG